MLNDYTTSFILKMYTLMNLIFILLLLSHDLTFYLVLIEIITLYFGLGTIRCMIEGNCKNEVLWIFIFYFVGHLLSLFIARGYFPGVMKKLKKIDGIIKDILKQTKFN